MKVLEFFAACIVGFVLGIVALLLGIAATVAGGRRWKP
jgi:hypothetical protein